MDTTKLKTRAKRFVEDHKTDVAYAAGLAVSYVVCTIIYTRSEYGNEPTSITVWENDEGTKWKAVIGKRNGKQKATPWVEYNKD